MERATPVPASRAKTKHAKGSTTAKRVVHEERVLAITAPSGSRFKGYEDFVVQNLRLAIRSAPTTEVGAGTQDRG